MTQFGLFPAVTGPEIKTHNLYFILPFLSCAVGCPQETFSRNLHRSAGFPPRLNGFESLKVVMRGSGLAHSADKYHQIYSVKTLKFGYTVHLLKAST